MKRNVFAMVMVAVFALVMTLGVTGCKKAEDKKDEAIPTMEQPKDAPAADAAKPAEEKKAEVKK